MQQDAAQWELWDVRRSLFDNHMSTTFEQNLEYMYKRFGFALPDPPALRDPQGMLQYLGAKLQYGHVPLYSRGDNPDAKQFGSLHAVQRHMVDSRQFGVCYEGNEDEYDEFYDYECAFTKLFCVMHGTPGRAFGCRCFAPVGFS